MKKISDIFAFVVEENGRESILKTAPADPNRDDPLHRNATMLICFTAKQAAALAQIAVREAGSRPLNLVHFQRVEETKKDDLRLEKLT